MDVYASDEERVEALKKWWKENSTAVIGGVLLSLGVVFGGRAWIEHNNTKAETASHEYQGLLSAMAQGKPDLALDIGGRIIGQYANTPYAALAALASAKIKVDNDELTAAQAHFQWVISNAEQEGVKHTARLRLSQVFLSQDEPDKALSLLTQQNPGSFIAAYEDRKGDIYLALNKPDLARNAFQAALNKLEPKARIRTYVQMKLDDLGKVDDGNEAKQ